MDNGLFTQVVEEQISLCKDVLVKKGAEYTPGVDRLSNFRSAAAAQGITMKQALAGMMAKHTISVYDMIWSGEEYPMEMWEEKLGDHLNYLLILKAILVEEQLQGAERRGNDTLRQAGAALATASGRIPKFDIKPGEHTITHGDGTEETLQVPVMPDPGGFAAAIQSMPTFFGGGVPVDEQMESD